MFVYLDNRKQRAKAHSSYSDFDEILTGAPQGSILGLLLSNIYILCSLFYGTDNLDMASYADNTPFTFSPELDATLKKTKKKNRLKKFHNSDI